MELRYFTGIADESDAKKQYRKLAKKYHPDKAKSDAERDDFGKIMQEINEEFKEVLVLVKYKVLFEKESDCHARDCDINTEKPLNTGVSTVRNTIKTALNLFKLKPDQQQELINKGRDTVNFIYDSLVQNWTMR